MSTKVLRRTMKQENGAERQPTTFSLVPRSWWVLMFVVAVVPAMLLILRPAHLVPDAPLMEDGYYSYTVSRNIALGRGITITEGMETNGFQPWFTFLSVPLFWVAGPDRYEAVRLMLVLHWLLYLATAYFLGRIASDYLEGQHEERPRWWTTPAFWFPAFLYLASIFVFLQHFNGLETGCLLLLYSVTWRYYQRARLDTLRGVGVLGILLGVLVLARIDAVFFVMLLCFYQFVSPEAPSLRQRMQRFMGMAGLSFLVTLPWWLYNLIGFGHLIPSSGIAQQTWAFSLPRLQTGLAALTQVFLPPLPLTYLSRISPALSGGVQVVSILAVLVVLWLTRDIVVRPLVRPLLERVRPHTSSRRTAEFGAILLLSALVLFCWYVVSTPAVYFYPRYFAPVLPLSTLALGVGLARVYHTKPAPGLATAALVLLALPLLTSAVLRQAGLFFPGNPYYRDQIPLVERYVPDEDYVAAFESGTLGYFHDRTINLDGKVNPGILSLDTQEDFIEYLRRRGVRWAVRRTTSERVWDSWYLVERRGMFGLYKRRDPAGSSE